MQIVRRTRFIAALAAAMGMALAAPVAAQDDDDAPGNGDDEEQPVPTNDGDDANDEGEPEEPPPPTEEEIAQAREAYAKGAELFEAEDFDGAVTEFKKSYRLSRNPLLLYNIGFTLDEMGNKKLALFYFEKFLADAPEDADKRREVKRSVRLLKREIELEERAAKANADAAEEPKKEREPVTEFMHKVVEEAPPGKPLDITAFVPELADWQVTLFYRGAGKAKYTSVSMRERYNELVGRIPPRVMSSGSMVQYYIEAVDSQGKTVAQSGKSTSPHLVLIEEGAKPIYYPDLTGERDWEGAGSGTVGGGGTGGGGNGRSDDEGRDRFLYYRWAATGAAGAFLTMSVSFLVSAGNYSDTLEGEADASRGECGTPPCRSFSNVQKDLQSRGKRFEKVSRWTFGLGLVSAGVAGYFWYRELFGKKDADEDRGTAVAPVFDRDYVGAAAQWSF